MTRMVRLEDVARRAGVSVSTVSNVVNGRTARMNPDILGRVRGAIDALGYQPNRAARFLKTGHTPLIGLLVPSIANPIYGSVAREVEVAAQASHGYRILVGNTYRDPEKERSFLGDLLSHGIRGVIIVSPLLEEAHFRTLIPRGLVAVSFDRRRTPGIDLDVDYVSMDNAEAARIAVRHLVEHGHRHLAYVTPTGRTVSRSDKVTGFLEAVRGAGLAEPEVIEDKAHSEYGDAEMAQLGRAFARTLLARKRRPTGILAMNDMLAIGLVLGLQAGGVRVPDDVSVIGIDDMFLSSILEPAITTVRLPLRAMAATVVDRIVYRLANPLAPTEEFSFAPELVSRGSVARLAGRPVARVAGATRPA